MEAAQNPDDLRLATLVGELSVQDPLFRQWWARHRVAIKRRGTRTFDHPRRLCYGRESSARASIGGGGRELVRRTIVIPRKLAERLAAEAECRDLGINDLIVELSSRGYPSPPLTSERRRNTGDEAVDGGHPSTR